jgi:hypothetical protein
VDQARRLMELEQENAKLKRLVSELSLEKLEGHRFEDKVFLLQPKAEVKIGERHAK